MKLAHGAPLLLVLILMIGATRGPAQTSHTGTLSGRVVDAESGAALEDVILFLADTPLSAVSDSEGRFGIPEVPPGEYELIISRLGYARNAQHVLIRGSDTVALEIALSPRPVPLVGVDVAGSRELESRQGPLLFFPAPSPHAYAVYGNNSSPPIGILFSDSALYMLAADTAIVRGEKYMKVWLLCKNLTDHPIDFDPMTQVTLQIAGRGRSYRGIAPVPPSEVAADVPIGDVVGGPQKRVAATIDRLLLFRRLIRPGYIRPQLRFRGRMLDAEGETEASQSGGMQIRVDPAKNPGLESMSTDYLAKVYQSSTHAGMLVRYMVYPGNSVDGFLFFPMPGLDAGETVLSFDEALQYEYEIDIQTPSGRKTIAFTPN